MRILEQGNKKLNAYLNYLSLFNNDNSNSYYNNKVNLSVKFGGRQKISGNRANVAKVKPEVQNAIISISDNIKKCRLKSILSYN